MQTLSESAELLQLFVELLHAAEEPSIRAFFATNMTVIAIKVKAFSASHIEYCSVI